ncbi:kynureninase [Alkaliphilus peptidifermentans]|uniref:Kynureninase n=1 Tax=Alkaliphilus peptidifermentans DSM 18978 TaxID=1120976 RepID=A0A1G5FU90_9FIRM|nr:kynureninase [Alkaliphilus peptidifermentans]SCY42687.1 Kynureninase [Alkaliphilus peptidifermentans DSM 18978]
MVLKYELGEEYANKLDSLDPLKDTRNRFYLNKDEIYMDGNSLGLMSKDAEKTLLRVMDEWKNFGINGWSKAEIPWIYYPEELGKLQAALVGARQDEVIIHSSTTVNLHSLVSTFFQPSGKRNKILMDSLTFPSDRYAIESQLKLKGLDPNEYLVIVESKDEKTIDEDEIVNNMSEEIALIMLPSVLYRSGQLLDMEYLTKEAHKRGIIIGFDCCHSVGAIPHKLSEWGVDFAFWCNYKYVNNGPGGAASMYINSCHFDKEPGLAGWYGYFKEKQFDLSNNFESANNVGGWQIGTSHILSMAPLEGSLKMFNEIGIERIREKSLNLTGYLMYLIDNELYKYGFKIGTPRENNKRGGHVALEHEEAIRINEALKDLGIVPDFRYPNIIRLAPVALYVSYKEVWKVVSVIKEVMDKEIYKNYSNKRGVIA